MEEDPIALARDAMFAGRLDEAAQAMTRYSGGEPVFELCLEPLPWPLCVVKWRIEEGRAVISLNDRRPHTEPVVPRRLTSTLPLIVHYQRNGRERGSIFLSLFDCGAAPGLAFCSNCDDHTLIPDHVFLRLGGYREAREEFAKEPVPWEGRRPVAFWRGATTGHRAGRSWRTLPRIRLCETAARPETAALFDVGIAGMFAVTDREEAEIEACGLVREWVPTSALDRWRIQIDIDGNTNSFPGLFQKLLSGSPVLKVASAGHFRQWYYDRLSPWENYVPVEPEMRDLVDKVRWLLAHDEEARRIGRRGAKLAHAMTFETEIRAAVAAVEGALRRARAETPRHVEIKPLTTGEAGEPVLREPDLDALEDRGRGEEAIAAIRKAIAITPGNAHFHSLLGHHLARQGRTREAIAAAREAIAAEPDNAQSSAFLAALLERGGCE